MIKDIKLGLTVMKYGLNYHGVIALIFTMAGAGLLFSVLMPMSILPGLLLGVGIMGVMQSVYSLSTSTMVLSSVHQKKLRITIPVIFATVTMLLANTCNIICCWVSNFVIENNKSIILQLTHKINEGDYQGTILLSSFVWVCMLVFGALFMRFLWITLLIMFLLGRMGLISFLYLWVYSYSISVEMAVFLSYVIVLFGCGILYALNCLCYKYPISERKFRKWMKYEAQ